MRRIFSNKDKSKKSRKEIEDEAFAQMRKAKAAIDPGVLAKVRKAIQNSPMAAQLMGNVYAQEEVKSKQEPSLPAKPISASRQESDVVKEAPKQVAHQPQKKKTSDAALQAAKRAHANVKDHEVEQVDQGKMIDIVAKMLELNPHNQSLKKGVKDILKDR